ncbi:MAG: hypothetical protein ACLP2Y_05925 [Limisphaerales bacterium]
MDCLLTGSVLSAFSGIGAVFLADLLGAKPDGNRKLELVNRTETLNFGVLRLKRKEFEEEVRKQISLIIHHSNFRKILLVIM